MTAMRKFASTLLAAAALCSAGALIYYVLAGTWSIVGKVSPNVGAAIVAAVATAAVAIYNQRTTRLREVAESHRSQKIEVYGVFMDIIDMIMNMAKKGELDQITDDSSPAKLEELMTKFRRGLLVWASPEVILSWRRMRQTKDQFEVLRRADDVFRAIRKDLGNSNWGLTQGELMKLFLKDPGEYDRLLGSGEKKRQGFGV